MAATASDVMSSLQGPLKEENGAKEKEGVRVGERMRPPEPHWGQSCFILGMNCWAAPKRRESNPPKGEFGVF